MIFDFQIKAERDDSGRWQTRNLAHSMRSALIKMEKELSVPARIILVNPVNAPRFNLACTKILENQKDQEWDSLRHFVKNAVVYTSEDVLLGYGYIY